MSDFLGTDDGWLDGYSPIKQKKIKKPAVKSINKEAFKRTVIYVPVRCPECGSDQVRCYGKARGEGRVVRYHQCQVDHCLGKFQSIEVLESEIIIKNNLF